MSIGLKDGQSVIQAGVATFPYTLTQAGVFTLAIGSSVVPPSSLVISINKNGGAAIVTSPTPSATQNHVDLIASGVLCAANDIINFVLTDSVATDNVKSLINITAETLFV